MGTVLQKRWALHMSAGRRLRGVATGGGATGSAPRPTASQVRTVIEMLSQRYGKPPPDWRRPVPPSGVWDVPTQIVYQFCQKSGDIRDLEKGGFGVRMPRGFSSTSP